VWGVAGGLHDPHRQKSANLTGEAYDQTRLACMVPLWEVTYSRWEPGQHGVSRSRAEAGRKRSSIGP